MAGGCTKSRARALAAQSALTPRLSGATTAGLTKGTHLGAPRPSGLHAAVDTRIFPSQTGPLYSYLGRLMLCG